MKDVSISSWQDGAAVEVRVQPRSSRNQLVGSQGGSLKVKLTSPPVDGEANQALIGFMADILGVGRRSIEIIRGETSKLKLIGIHGIAPAEVELLLEKASIKGK